MLRWQSEPYGSNDLVVRLNGSKQLLWKRDVAAGMEGRSLAAATPRLWQPNRTLSNLFSGTLSRQRLLHSAVRARLQVEGVTLHFPDGVFCLNLALESTQGVLDRLTLLQSNFCQTHHSEPKLIRHI